MIMRILNLLLLLSATSAFCQSPVPPGATLEKIATGFQFVEGPVWKNGTGLLFSDINGNKMYKWSSDSGATVFMNPSNNSNGLTFDGQGRLVFCQMGYRRVARVETDGSRTSLASTWKGKALNSPNDVVVKSDGAIFFTDPDYNIPTGQKKELSFCGIYRINQLGDLQLLDSTLQEPNGICFSPDETKFYVNDSGKRIIYVWDVVDDSAIANKRQFAVMATSSGNADGMKADSSGNIFSAGPLGIWVFSPSGATLDTILVPGQTTNCNWGDSDRKTLYITAGNSVYRIRLAKATGIDRYNLVRPSHFKLYSNFPNPFNPETIISYQLSAVGRVTLKVYDILGRELATLVNDIQTQGKHAVTFNASSLTSGTYLYKLESNSQSEFGKMVLMK